MFCDIWKIKPENEININNIINSFKGIEKDVYWISFSGGEVTLIKYYYKLIDELKKKLPNLKIIAFTTNCLLPNRVLDYSLYIKNNGFDPLITLSLDGDEKTHDNLRGIKGNYQKCIETYENLRKNNILCHYGITLSKDNHKFVKEKYNKFKNSIKKLLLLCIVKEFITRKIPTKMMKKLFKV